MARLRRSEALCVAGLLRGTRGTDNCTIHLHKHFNHLPGPVEKNQANSVNVSYCKNMKTADVPARSARPPTSSVSAAL